MPARCFLCSLLFLPLSPQPVAECFRAVAVAVTGTTLPQSPALPVLRKKVRIEETFYRLGAQSDELLKANYQLLHSFTVHTSLGKYRPTLVRSCVVCRRSQKNGKCSPSAVFYRNIFMHRRQTPVLPKETGSPDGGSSTRSPITPRHQTRKNFECVDIRIKNRPFQPCLLYTSPSPRDVEESRMPSSA